MLFVSRLIRNDLHVVIVGTNKWLKVQWQKKKSYDYLSFCVLTLRNRSIMIRLRWNTPSQISDKNVGNDGMNEILRLSDKMLLLPLSPVYF